MSLQNFVDLLVDESQFEIVKELGKGAFGEVYKVKNKKTNKISAMKKSLKSDLNYDDTKYFLSEVIALASMKHPALLTLDGFKFPGKGEGNGSLILTDFLEGGGLDTAIDAAGVQPEWLDDTQKMIIMAGICAGLSYLHGLKILHRDLKPANILLTKNHEPKIADFGLAKFYQGSESQQVTKCGTKAYMPPEVFTGTTPNTKCDVYALGFIFYELCTHKDPYKGLKSMGELLRGKRNSFPDKFQPHLKDLIEALWSIDPDERPSAYQAFQLLGSKDFFLPNTDVDKYMEYYNRIDAATEPDLPPEQKIPKKIADAGDPIEQYNMSKHFSDPSFKGSLDQMALRYLHLSAKQNYSPALYDLALYYEGKDNEKAFELMSQAASQLYLRAIFKQGIYLRDGIGCKAQPSVAQRTLERAGSLGESEAYLELAYSRATGEGLRKDMKSSKKYFDSVNQREVSKDKNLKSKLKKIKELLN